MEVDVGRAICADFFSATSFRLGVFFSFAARIYFHLMPNENIKMRFVFVFMTHQSVVFAISFVSYEQKL